MLASYFQLLRLPAVFTVWSNIIAAHLISTSGSFEWSVLSLTLCSSSAFYLGGMVLNDCFDLDEDLRERPQRPLPSGAIPTSHAWRLGWGLILLGIALAGAAGTQQLIIGILLTFSIIAYNSWLKHHAVGCLIMGSCRYLNWLLGLAVVPLAIEHYLLPLPILLYIMAITILSRIETTANQEGPITACIAGIIAAAIAIFSLYYFDLLSTLWPVILGIILLLVMVAHLAKLYSKMEPTHIQRSVKILLMGIIPLDAMMVSATGLWWGGLIVILLLIPGQLLVRIIKIT